MTKICRWRSSRWISVPQTPYTPRNQIRKNPNQFIHSSIHVWILLLFLSPSFPLITIFPPSSVQTPSSPTLSLLTLSSFLKCKKLYIGEKIGFIYFEIIVSILSENILFVESSHGLLKGGPRAPLSPGPEPGVTFFQGSILEKKGVEGDQLFSLHKKKTHIYSIIRGPLQILGPGPENCSNAQIVVF